jgi:transposase InsO family protein
MNATTGRLHEHKKPRIKKIRRPRGAHCLELDTVVRFIDGVKRYVVTAVDTEHRFAFAGAYTSHTSGAAADLLRKYALVAPAPLPPIQTDNGSEFADRFASACKNLGLTQYHTYPHCPKMNGHVERFNRTLSEDFIEGNRDLLRHDIAAFNRKLADWLLWYNSERPHEALGQIAPLRYICNQLTPRECQMWWTRTIA